MSENENNNDPSQTDSAVPAAKEGDLAFNFSHVVGVSSPQDSYGTPSGAEHRSDAELVAMGVEPDEGPGAGLITGTLAIIGILVAVGFGTIELFKYGAAWQTGRVAGDTSTQLADIQAASAELLTTPAALEGTAGHYRIPITDAIAALDSNSNLLEGHPLGTPSEMALPPGALPPPPPPPFVPGMVDPLTGLVMLAPGIACIPGVGATAIVPEIDPVTNLPLPLPPIPPYDLLSCQFVPVAAEGSGVMDGALAPTPVDGAVVPLEGSGHGHEAGQAHGH